MLLRYNAATLKLERRRGGQGWFPALVADRSGYLYASGGGDGIYVYAPGCTRVVHVIDRGSRGTDPLVFDRSGNLYAGNADSATVSVYAPTGEPGHMRLVRLIADGINNPSALAIGRSGDLVVVNTGQDSARGNLTVYRAGTSVLERTITAGIDDPGELAFDSRGRLYVTNLPRHPISSRGWISIFPPRGTEPIGKITDGIRKPVALAVDPSNNLYVADIVGRVTVYSAKDGTLLRTITRGVKLPQALLIGSP
jgi:glucose/arabinose dehydrogenase